MNRTIIVTLAENVTGPCGWRGPMWQMATQIDPYFVEDMFTPESTFVVNNLTEDMIAYSESTVVWQLPKGYYHQRFVVFKGELLSKA